jgi:TonB family protein
MTTATGRTFVGSVLSIDLGGYSMRSVAQQERVTQRFTRLLQKALQSSPSKGRTILDTGDGALITFLGDPEQCFALGLRVRDVMNAAAQELGCNPGTYPVRLGIHLGSVKLSTGLSGNPSIVGDGVNVAERIVGFAEPGQIVVSRAFYDVISRLSDAHARLLVPGGTRTDKNAREHEIFVVAPPAPSHAAASTRAPSATVSFRPRTLAMVAGGIAAIALAAGGAWFLLARKGAEPAVALKSEPPPAAPAKIEPLKPERAPQPSPVPPPERRTASRGEPVRTESSRAESPRPASRSQSEPEKFLSALTGAAKSVGSTTQNVLSTVGEKARSITQGGGPATYATPVSRSAPAFPPAAAAQGIHHGTVRARLEINASGYVTHVDLLQSDPPRVFDQEAIRTLQRWRFNSGADGRTYDAELEFRR